MQKIANKQICSGCGACFNACPVQCITMKADGEGFSYPYIDETKCLHCGKCDKVCPVLNKRAGHQMGDAYAAINTADDIRMKSSSGGIFSIIAEFIIEQNGLVFGAAFDKELDVKHTYIENKDELDKIRGSKYVQSLIGDTYKQAEDFLKSNRIVLFTGTPCQISGLKSYLGKDYNNLITQDIICHGVPSPMIWQKYIKYREKQAESPIQSVFFRHKKYGWENYSMLFKFKDGKKYEESHLKDGYMQAFVKNYCLRPSCYDCNYKTLERESDITLADFWGVKNVEPEMYDKNGTSLVIINSQKGQELFNHIKDKMLYKETDLLDAVKYNSSAVKSSIKPKGREDFLKQITENDFEKIAGKYMHQSFVKKIIKKIRMRCLNVQK